MRSVLGPPRPAGTILVVDDEPEIRNFLRKLLTGVSYQVLEAENGKEAVRQTETSKVDLVIMDLAMPEQEGIETIQALRRTLPQVKIIAISGQFAGPCCVRPSISAPKRRSPNPFSRMSCWTLSRA